MRATDTRKNYGIVSIALHWLVAAFIVFQFVSGKIFESLGKAPRAGEIRGIHIAVGAIAAIFIVARFVWRLYQGSPEKIGDSRALNILSQLVQWALLLAMIGAVITGVLVVWSGGRDIGVFGLITLPTPMTKDEDFHEMMEEVHEFVTNIMLPLVVLHVLGALKHLIIDRDGVMARIFIPASRS